MVDLERAGETPGTGNYHDFDFEPQTIDGGETDDEKTERTHLEYNESSKVSAQVNPNTKKIKKYAPKEN
jgi:hypothetical protein